MTITYRTHPKTAAAASAKCAAAGCTLYGALAAELEAIAKKGSAAQYAGKAIERQKRVPGEARVTLATDAPERVILKVKRAAEEAGISSAMICRIWIEEIATGRRAPREEAEKRVQRTDITPFHERGL
jgi:hypothetical protein